jgi:hypothetical protein
MGGARWTQAKIAGHLGGHHREKRSCRYRLWQVTCLQFVTRPRVELLDAQDANETARDYASHSCPVKRWVPHAYFGAAQNFNTGARYGDCIK